jgi:hypothetical protein
MKKYDTISILCTLAYSLYGIIQYASKIGSLNNINPRPYDSVPYIDLVWGIENAIKIRDLMGWLII